MHEEKQRTWCCTDFCPVITISMIAWSSFVFTEVLKSLGYDFVNGAGSLLCTQNAGDGQQFEDVLFTCRWRILTHLHLLGLNSFNPPILHSGGTVWTVGSDHRLHIKSMAQICSFEPALRLDDNQWVHSNDVLVITVPNCTVGATHHRQYAHM